MHTCIHAKIHTYTHAYTHTHIHTHTHTHTHIIFIQTYIRAQGNVATVLEAHLQGDRDAGPGGKLPRPHAGAVDHELARDVLAVRSAHAADAPVAVQHVGNCDALDNLRALPPSALAQRHSSVDGVDTAVICDVKAPQHVIDAA